MKARCLFRFSPFGFIYESTYDIYEGTIDCIPEEVFKVILTPEYYQQVPPFDIRKWNKGGMEHFMIEHPSVYLTIDFGGGAFYVLDEDRGIFLATKSGRNKKAFDWDYKWYSRWIEIGYAPTVVRQFSVRPYVSIFACDKAGRVLLPTGDYTNEWFALPVNMESLTGVPESFAGYRECINRKADATIYVNGDMRFLYRHENSIMLAES